MNQGEASDIEWLRFIDLTSNGGMGWKDVEGRFDRLAFAQCQIEPVLKWSDFGLCIGEQTYILLFVSYSIQNEAMHAYMNKWNKFS